MTVYSERPVRHAYRSLGLILLSSVLLTAAPSSEQRSFATPREAIDALIHASERNDTHALFEIFGPEGAMIVESADPAEDKADRKEFADLARQKIRVNEDPANPDRATFFIGDEEWPFPVPLVREDGKWVFDSSKGRVEILAHRIGENELDTADTCRAFVEAELAYAASDHEGGRTLQYAQRMLSTKGKQDGLYSEDAAKSFIPLSFAKAVADENGNSHPEPFHGYYFRILKEQGPESPGGSIHYLVDGKMIGGFALVAWPAEYGNTGIQTFIVNHQGVVYSKDLGSNTAAAAGQIMMFNPDKSWHPVETD